MVVQAEPRAAVEAGQRGVVDIVGDDEAAEADGVPAAAVERRTGAGGDGPADDVAEDAPAVADEDGALALRRGAAGRSLVLALVVILL
ncbi:MAG TPA: hypothetical protein PKA74_15380, partial [Bauldia sp.]|nr:hypothetical protein [Bauldia sp.]